MKKRNYYHPYHGRSGLKVFVRILLIVVIVAVIAGIIFFFYLRQHLVITEDGVQLDLPFLSGQTSDETTASEDLPETTDSMEDDALEEEDTPPVVIVDVPEEEEEVTPVSPVALDLEALYDGTAASQVEEAGGDSALFDMKPDSGVLSYRSVMEYSFSEDLSTLEPEDLNTSIVALNKTDLYTIARVSCFRDNGIPQYDSSFSILTRNGYRWKDSEDIYWISPTSEEVQTYLIGVCDELARLGFREILLDYAGYPSSGDLDYIPQSDAYNSENFSTVIGTFYQNLQDALSGYDVTLSIVTTQEALDGTDELTGQTPENLSYAGRLWMKDETGALYPLAEDS